MRWCSRLMFALGLLLWGATVLAEVSVPALRARVTDLTQTLNATQREALEQKLAALEQAKGAQIAVLLVPTTQPETIEQYARRVLDEWKLGRKGVDDGALLLIAKNDRKLRIETQYGLEGIIPDAVAKRIISEDITPYFKQNDFYRGIDVGVSRMISLVQGDSSPGASNENAHAPAILQDALDEIDLKDIENNIVLLVAFFILIGRLIRIFLGRFLGAVLAGGALGALIWTIMGSLSYAVLGGAVAFFLVFVGYGIGGTGIHRGRVWGSGGGWGGGGGLGGGGGASGSW